MSSMAGLDSLIGDGIYFVGLWYYSEINEIEKNIVVQYLIIYCFGEYQS
jgi:hypothetical protein